jgi:AAA-like domain/TIR domain
LQPYHGIEINSVGGAVEKDLLPTSVNSIEVFFSYAHEDEKLRDKLANHLTALKNQNFIDDWHDREISAGTEWASEIDQAINSARLILLLISDDFLASKYCYDIELKRAMERHEAKEASVIPIILRPVDWSGSLFGKLQALPKNAKPVTTWKNRDEAFVDIAQGIRKVIEVMRETPAPSPALETIPAVKPSDSEPSPLAEKETRVAIELEPTNGQVPLNSPFYIERPPIEADCYSAIANPGTLILIKAPRQMGKTSLMSRVLAHGKVQYGYKSVQLLFQEADKEVFSSLEVFLKWFCSTISYELNLEDKVEEYWKGVLGNRQKCTNYFQRYLLEQLQSPLILGLDEADLLFEHFEIAEGFFALLRAWHEKAKNESIWQKLHLVIDHSQEVYISLNVHQSPFNVGQTFKLGEFNKTQVVELVQRHNLNWSEQMVDRLMGMVDGHPYLLRTALYKITRGELTLEQFLALAPTEEGPFGNHLRDRLLRVEADPNLTASFKRVVTSQDPVELDSDQQFKLCSMGLTELRGNSVIPLCNLYRLYFCDRLKDSA